MPSAPALAPLASLAAHWQACTGEVPPALVGASVTLIDDPKVASRSKLYLFGGRLVTTRRMVNDMYELDMATLHWTRLFSEQAASSSSAPRPQPRYFHSCNAWNGKLVIFGGMGYLAGGAETDLCVLNEVVAFDLATQSWDLHFDLDATANVTTRGDEDTRAFAPQPRYAHLSSISGDSLVIIGGQDLGNSYVEEVNVFDLKLQHWEARQAFSKQRGSYRSLAIEAQWHIANADTSAPSFPTTTKRARSGSLTSSKQEAQISAAPNVSKVVTLLPSSTREYDEHGKVKPLPIYIYTNYNFTDVKREMEVMKIAKKDADTPVISIDDKSGEMKGLSLPPGLRFPMGAVLGSHLLISGTYLANTSQTFAVWALYLPTMTWTRLDVGAILSSGSWNRGVLWPSQNRLLIFGHRERDLVADYNHRQTNWDHVLTIDLDAWGICQPPVFNPNRAAIDLGLEKLASSAIGSFAAGLGSDFSDASNGRPDVPSLTLAGRGDFEIVCSDGMRLGCDRAVLERRWPWFAKQIYDYRQRLNVAAKSMIQPRSFDAMTVFHEMEKDKQQPANDGRKAEDLTSPRTSEPRITPRQLVVNDSSPVMLAVLTFLYTGCICTTLQRHPAIIAALLIASRVYQMDDLAQWAQFAAHCALSTTLAAPPSGHAATSSQASIGSSVAQDFDLLPMERHRLAVMIYEAATISAFEQLQIRALRSVMAIAKWVQRTSLSSRSSSMAGHGEDSASNKELILDHRNPQISSQSSARANSGSSPHGSRRSSVSTSDGQIPSLSWRDSRPERLPHLRDTDESSSKRNSAMPSAPPSSFHSTRRPSAASLQGNLRGNGSASAANKTLPVPNAHTAQLKPRSPMGPPPVVASSLSSSGRKRFSLFGRGSEMGKMQPLADGYQEDSVGGMPRMHRSLTSSSMNDAANLENGPWGSVQNGNGSSTPTQTVSSAAFDSADRNVHDSSMSGSNGAGNRPRQGSIGAATNAGGSAGRKMTATLSRFKAARTPPGPSSPAYAVDGSTIVDGINPLRPTPANVPSSARSSMATTATLTGSSSATSAGQDLRNESDGNGNRRFLTGSLSDKDLKALQSISA